MPVIGYKENKDDDDDNDNLKRKTEWSLQGEKEQSQWANIHLVYWNVGYKEGETSRWKHKTFHTFWITP